MKQLFPRGKRIRPTDKDLVFHTALAALFPVFLLVVLLFHTGQIAGTNWQEVSLSQIVQDVNIPYLLFSMGMAGLVCLTAVLLFWRYRRDEVKQLIHRQKLARMVLENKWYESEQRKEDAFFKDLSSSRSKEIITYFPKIYYRMKQGLLHIRVEITLGKYQEQLLNLEKKLESGLYCELTDKELKDSYVEYTLLYDTIANRISIEDVQAKDGISVLHSCDLAVSRAGATTLAEMTALGTASIIIPSPYVVANHQEYNARELVAKGAAHLILEKDLNADAFVEVVDQYMNNEEMRKELSKKALALGKPHACEDIYKEILKLTGGR